MKTLFATLAASIALALPAQAFFAQNGLTVRPLSGDQFEVRYRGLSGAPHFWCSAGDYVIQKLGLPAATRIYRVSPPPRRAGEGVIFSLSPEGATSTGLVTLYGRRDSLNAISARHYCDVVNM